MKQIKTIKNRLDNNEDFDAKVNAALAEGWKLVKREVIKPTGQPVSNTYFHTMLYAELERDAVSPDIQRMFDYIEGAFRRPHGESFWIDEKGFRTIVDVGYAAEWWNDCMKPELERVMDSLMKEDANA